LKDKIMNAKDDYLSERSHKEMAEGVLTQAKQDLRRFRGDTSKIGRELYLDAYTWLIANQCSWPFSFLNVCEVLNLPPESLRQELMSDMSLGAFGYWTHQCGRAARRLPRWLSQLFPGEPATEAKHTVLQNAGCADVAI
jgi:hypothetical protein